VDGALNGREAGVEKILTALEGSIIEQSYSLEFRATNNEA